jgi:hypothetical protein
VEGREPISWCLTCGNNIHSSCCDMWASTKRARGGEVSCVYCRAPWADGSRPGAARIGGGAGSGGGGGGGGGRYLNLKDYSETHREADTSLAALYPRTSNWIAYWAREHGE